MMRSSRGARAACLLASISTPSSARSASSSSVNLATGGLCFHAGEKRHAFGHAALPRIGSGDIGQTATLLFELHGAPRELSRLFRRQAHLLGVYDGLNLFQALLAHGLGEDCPCFTERVDPVD